MLNMKLTNQQKILIGGGSVLILFIISLIIFLIIYNHKSKSNDICKWSVGDWTPCSDESKTQKRDVTCKNNEGGICDNSNCTGTQPDNTRDCINPDICEWSVGEWTPPCSESKTQSRTVTCENNEGDDCTTCTENTKPASTRDCINPDICTWSVGDWIPCSETSTTQSRTVTCENNEGDDCTTCTENTKPPTTNICQLNCCNQSYWTCSISDDHTTCPTNTSKTYNCSYCTSNIFPPNVYKFYPGNDRETQQIIDTIFSTQGGTEPENHGQNSKLNYAFLFMPGTYNLNIPIGFYTHVAGLGKTNNEVIINGGPRVDNGSTNYKVGALNNFWRTCENMTVYPTNHLQGDRYPSMIYAVSQSCSLRSVTVNGILHLGAMEDGGMGFASGGFMANCNITEDLNMGSQQQFICRNTEYGSFPVALWNQVNVGCKSNEERGGCCINTTDPQISSSTLTVVDKTPLVMEKPYLAYDTGDGIVVLCPGILSNTKGNTLFDSTSDKTITKDNYRIVTDNITVSDLNTYLSNTNIKCIIFSPGRYNIDSPINLNGQLLFGLGLPVLTSTKNNNIIKGDGSICGIIFDAGYSSIGIARNNILVNLTNPNPSYLWDIVCRVGGGDDHNNIYEVNTILYIGGDNSILDNVWCWVADHYADNNKYVGWENAVCQIGVHVTGYNVIAYGLFAEHTRDTNVLWEGDKGEVYMFQSEFNYFPPPDFQNFYFAAYDVRNVTAHTLKGAGAYSFFPSMTDNARPTTMANAGFNFEDVSKIDYENLTTVFLNGYGGIRHVFYDEKTEKGYGTTVQRDLNTDEQTQISVICNKYTKSFCSCKDAYPQDTSCDTSQGRCKPNNNACTPEQMIHFGPCNVNKGERICPNTKVTGCFPPEATLPAGCDPCEWW